MRRCECAQGNPLSTIIHPFLSFIAQSTVDKDIWLDPTEEEVRLGRGTFMLACMPALGSITSVWQTGAMPPQEAIQVRDYW